MTTLCPVCLESVQDIIDCDKHGTCPSCLKTMFMKKYECSIEDAMENGYVVNCPLCRKEVSATVISVYQTGHHSEDARAAAPPPTSSQFCFSIENDSEITFNIFLMPSNAIHSQSVPVLVQDNVAPGTTITVNVGRRGDIFKLVTSRRGTYLTDLETYHESSDNYEFTRRLDILELVD